METISLKELIGLPVYTQSGEALGKVSGLEMETGSQQIVNYLLKPSSIIKELLVPEPEFIIPSQRVLEITRQKMIVEDLVLKEKGILGKRVSPMPLG